MSPDRLTALRGLPRNGLYALTFNTAIALLLAAVGFGGGFVANFVYSQCFGLTAWLLCDGSWRLLWPDKRAPALLWIPLVVVELLLAWLGGTWLAASLLGHRFRGEPGLTSLVVSATAAFLAISYFRERAKTASFEAAAAREKSRADTIERQVTEARLKLLQAQIEPHFLFNTLANLHALIGVDPPRAQKMLDHLNEFLRAALAATRNERSTLRDEFALLRDYLEIIAIRMDRRLEYRLDLPEALAGVQLPPMLLQPLVENAVKHGLEPKVEGGQIVVRARADGDRVELSVADSGRGLGAAATPGSGSGIAQVRARLAAAYGDAATFDIVEPAIGGVVVTLRVPFER